MQQNQIIEKILYGVKVMFMSIFRFVKFIIKSIVYILLAVLKLLLNILKLLSKPSKPCVSEEWTRDDDDFYHYFKKGGTNLSALDKDAHKFYTIGPVFFSKQFANEYNRKRQKECVKGWNDFLNHVSFCRTTRTINW